jgi:hypothetical protein
MLKDRTPRRLAALLLCVGVLLPIGPSWAQETDIPGPIHAGNTYGWYPTAWRDEFVGPLKQVWDSRGKGSVRTKNGMLTMTTGQQGSLSATLDMAGHDRGRWEIRMKTRKWGSGHPNYSVRTELIPAGDRPQYCGARNIALESYTNTRARAKFYIRNLPDIAFRATRASRGAPFGGDNWHTFAVEVTPNHISWFIDAHVVSTERRSEAFSGVPLTLRFSLKAIPHQQMNPAKLQVDWARYWTLDKPNDKSIDAPAPTKGLFKQACPPA